MNLFWFIIGFLCGAMAVLTILALHLFKELEAKVAAKWISVKERLPEVGGLYPVAIEPTAPFTKTLVQTAAFVIFEDGGKFSITGRWPDSHLFTHWQPLPDPPVQP